MYQITWPTRDKFTIYATNVKEDHTVRHPEPIDENQGAEGAEVLLEIAETAEKENWSGPDDLSENHDEYFIKASEKR